VTENGVTADFLEGLRRPTQKGKRTRATFNFKDGGDDEEEKAKKAHIEEQMNKLRLALQKLDVKSQAAQQSRFASVQNTNEKRGRNLNNEGYGGI
jgi:hypothetical protein